MIRWEGPLHKVECSSCGSTATDVLFEFLAFTRRLCRACGTTFFTIADSSAEQRRLTVPLTRKDRKKTT